MVTISPKTISMQLTIVCMAMLVLTGLGQAQLFPPILPGGQECLSSLQAIPGCVVEFFSSLFTGRIGSIGPTCCQAITQITDNCWSKVLPFSPFFPPLLKNFCAAPSPPVTGSNTVSKVTLQETLVPGQPDTTQCLSSLINFDECVLEIYNSLINGKIGVIGPACCKVVTEINDQCWPKIFPSNPFFPPLLKSACARSSGATLTPQALEKGSEPRHLPLLP